MSDETIYKSLIELKLQLFLEEINGETFLRMADDLRSLYLKSGKEPNDWNRLADEAEEDHSFYVARLRIG